MIPPPTMTTRACEFISSTLPFFGAPIAGEGAPVQSSALPSPVAAARLSRRAGPAPVLVLAPIDRLLPLRCHAAPFGPRCLQRLGIAGIEQVDDALEPVVGDDRHPIEIDPELRPVRC